MNELIKSEKLKKIRIAFWLNLPSLIISILIMFKSIESQVTWKITASIIGFLFFLFLEVLVFRQMIKLQISKDYTL